MVKSQRRKGNIGKGKSNKSKNENETIDCKINREERRGEKKKVRGIVEDSLRRAGSRRPRGDVSLLN